MIFIYKYGLKIFFFFEGYMDLILKIVIIMLWEALEGKILIEYMLYPKKITLYLVT